MPEDHRFPDYHTGYSLLDFYGQLLGVPRAARRSRITEMLETCDIQETGADKIPFICFDLSGGANIAGSNVLIGQRGGQLDLLSASGYSKQGLPADMTPAPCRR